MRWAKSNCACFPQEFKNTDRFLRCLQKTNSMKKARLGGVMMGLLLENRVLRLHDIGEQKWRSFKKKADKTLKG